MAPVLVRDMPPVEAATVRILLVADTHIGFDLPRRPRVERRRRGHDFLANFERALEPALAGEVDLVVHGGDLLFRSRVPATLVETALAPLVAVAERGVPVCIVPGDLAAVLRSRLAAVPADAVVRVRVPETLVAAEPALFTAARLRDMVPATANVELGVYRAPNARRHSPASPAAT
jgi:hypothetical protein